MTKGQAILYIFILIVACCSCTIIKIQDSEKVHVDVNSDIAPEQSFKIQSDSLNLNKKK